MNNAHSPLKKAVVAAFFLIWATPTSRSQSISPDSYVRAVAVSANGTLRAEVNLDGSLTVIGVPAQTQTRLNGLKPRRAFALALSPNGKFLAAADTQGEIQVWDLSTRSLVRTILQPGGVWSLAFDSQEKRLAAGGHKLVCVWDPNSGEQLRKWPIGDTSLSVSFDPNSKRLAAADFSVLHVWSLEGDESLEAKAKAFMIFSVAFSPDGRVVATGGDGVPKDGTIQLWKIGSVLTDATVGVLPNRVQALAFSPDGVSLAAGSPTGIVKLWSTANGNELQTINADEYIAMLAFSGGGRRLVAVTGPNLNEKSALLSWDLQTGKDNPR